MLGLIVIAADTGTGLSPRSLLEPFLGAPILTRAIAGGLPTNEAVTAVVVVPADLVDDVKQLTQRFGLDEVDRVVAGGPDRRSALRAGLEALPADVDVVVIQEGGRAMTPVGLVDRVVDAARKADAAVCAITIADVVGVDEGGSLLALDARPNLRSLQAPAAYKLETLKAGLDADPSGPNVDETEACARAGATVSLVDGDDDNRLLRDDADVSRALEIFSRRAADYAFVYPSDLLPDDPLQKALDPAEAKSDEA